MSKRHKKYSTQPTHQHPKFVPLTREQADAYELCWRSDITFLTGPAGCSKSYTAIAFGVDMLLNDRVERIIFTRPAVEACGENLGFLPGTAVQKVGSYMRPLFDNLEDYAKEATADIKKCLSIEPLAYMRGRTIKNSVLILDEAQNANMAQLKMLMTRIGDGSSMVICGDADQSDIAATRLIAVAEKMSQIEGIGHLHYTSTSAAIRHPLVPHILQAFEEMNSERTQNA